MKFIKTTLLFAGLALSSAAVLAEGEADVEALKDKAQNLNLERVSDQAAEQSKLRMENRQQRREKLMSNMENKDQLKAKAQETRQLMQQQHTQHNAAGQMMRHNMMQRMQTRMR